MAVVAGGKGGQGDLVIPGGGAQVPALPVDGGDALLPEGPVQKARLAEPAAPDTAPQHLLGDAVVDHLDHGHREALGVVGLVQVQHHTLLHPGGGALLGGIALHRAVIVVFHLIQGGHIHPGDLCRPAQELCFGGSLLLALAVELHHLQVHLFPVPQKEQVEEVGQRLGIAGTGAAPCHDVEQVVPVRRPQGDARQLQHVQHVGVAQLILKGEPDEVEVCHRVAALQGIEGHPLLPHALLHVHPGGEHPLAPKVRDLVHGPVQDLDAQMGHADLIGVREAEGEPDLHVILIFYHRIDLAAHIAAGLLHVQQNLF